MFSPMTLKSNKKTDETTMKPIVGVIADDNKQYITRDELTQVLQMMQQMQETMTTILQQQSNSKDIINDNVTNNLME